jgi:hypothetical protein
MEGKMKITACIFLSVIILAGCSRPQLAVNRETVYNAEETSSMPNHMGIISQYLEAVDKAILADLPNGKIDQMTRSSWRDEMQKQFRDTDTSSLGISLWSETQPVDNFVRLRIQCNILGLKQIPFASISPTLTIPVPDRNIRFEWYITTGNESLDKEIISIAKEKADIFQH